MLHLPKQLLMIGCLLLFSFLFYTPSLSVLAKDATFSATIQDSTSSALSQFDWLDRLLGRDKQEDISESLDVFNKSNLPYRVNFEPLKLPDQQQVKDNLGSRNIQSGDDSGSALDMVGGYTIAASTGISNEKVQTNLLSTVLNLLRRIGGIFGLTKVVELGDKKAMDLGGYQMPYEVIIKDEASNTINYISDQDSPGNLMGNVVPLLKCANVPPGVGDCMETNSPHGEPTPTERLPEPTHVLPTFPPQAPTGIPATTPVITPYQPPSGGLCNMGTGYCSPYPESSDDEFYMLKYFGNEQAAINASIICQKESSGDPFAVNRRCLLSDPLQRTYDYSIGLFQINLLAHCPNEFTYKNSSTKECRLNQGYVDPVTNETQCEKKYKDVDENIKKAVELSSSGTNWNVWSAASVCGIGKKGREERPTPPPVAEVAGCPAASEFINIPGTDYKHLDDQQRCITPNMMIIHWSGGWSGTEATFNLLNKRGLSCQLATDKSKQLQMLNFYKDRVQRGHCVGGYNNLGKAYNDYALNNEITGVYFDEIINKSSHPRYSELMTEVDKAIRSTCFMLKQYNIRKTQIFGHFELTAGKSDPGEAFLNYFIERVQNECN